MHVSRGELGRLALLAGGGAVALLAGCEKDEPDLGRRNGSGADGPALQALLRLEDVSVAFYEHALDRGLPPGAARERGERFLAHEREHVELLEGHARRLRVVRPRRAEVLFSIEGGPRRILTAAARAENLVAAGIAGQLRRLSDPRLLGDALAILAVEGAHAAALDALVGTHRVAGVPDQGSPALRPGAFDRPLEPDAVVQLLEGVGVHV